MDITQLKTELGLLNSDIAEFFSLSPAAYANSSAKKRYEKALCEFYELVKRKLEADMHNQDSTCA